MKYSKTPPKFRPITIVIETESEYDQFYNVISQVVEGGCSVPLHIVDAAKNIISNLDYLEGEA